MEEPYQENQNYQEPSAEDINNIPEEENVKIFNKYDNEFVGLLNEIGIRLPNFNEEDKSKIKSWINILSIPYNTNDTKKNRNLYGIKLVNQMINGKLEEPFINYANNNSELKWLSPKDIKNELSKQFFEEINMEKIENFGIMQQKKFLENHPDLANKIRNSQSSRKNTQSEFNQNSPNKMTNNTNNINYINTNSENNIITNNNNINNYIENYEDNLNERQYYPEEYNNNINNNFNNNMPYTNSKLNEFNIVNKINNNKNYSDKIKLVNIIKDLEQKVIERDEIIEYQNKQMEQIYNRILFIQSLKNNNNIINNEQ